MGVGMVTVFVILGLVVLSGQLLIGLSNRFSTRSRLQLQSKQSAPTVLKSKQVAAISAVVHQLSSGKAEIEKIEKISNSA